MSKAPEYRREARKVTVAMDDVGRRLDNFINSYLKNIPKSRIYQMLRRGEVRVNGSRAKQGYRLEHGDVIRLPPLWLASTPNSPVVPTELAKRLQKQILFEDDRLLVLNKPAGLAVHGGSGISHGVIEILRSSHCKQERLELVHRLDRDTSGCLLLAKNMAVLRSLHQLLRGGDVQKDYIALLKGRMARHCLAIDEPLGRRQNQSGEHLVTIDATGKPSATHIKRHRLYSQATLADISLLTGRTHQIRVHASAAGYPLAGDTKYGDRRFNKTMRQLGLRRLFLHAHRLALPDMGLTFEAPLPEDLSAVLDLLQ